MTLKILNEIPVLTYPWKGLGKKIEKLTRKALYEFHLCDDTPHIGIALSGGKDSLTLLYMLDSIRGRGFPNFEITAIHVSGAFSCGASIENHYLQKICASLNIRFVSLNTEQTLEKLECYSCARKRRQLIFHKARELNIKTVAFGHHLDDHVETLFLNLCQKGSFEGNLPKVPMIGYGVTIIRPLIFVEENDILAFAQSSGFARIMCQCPVGQNSKRKKMKTFIKSLQIEFPHAKKCLAHNVLEKGSKKALREDLIKSKVPPIPD